MAQRPNAAILRVDLELLTKILCLPEGMRVTAISPHDPWSGPDVALVRVDGEMLETVKNGELLPELKCIYERTDCGHATLKEWGYYNPFPRPGVVDVTALSDDVPLKSLVEQAGDGR